MNTRSIMVLVAAVVAVIVVAIAAGNYGFTDKADAPATTSTAPATPPAQSNQ